MVDAHPAAGQRRADDALRTMGVHLEWLTAAAGAPDLHLVDVERDRANRAALRVKVPTPNHDGWRYASTGRPT